MTILRSVATVQVRLFSMELYRMVRERSQIRSRGHSFLAGLGRPHCSATDFDGVANSERPLGKKRQRKLRQIWLAAKRRKQPLRGNKTPRHINLLARNPRFAGFFLRYGGGQ